MPHVVLGQILYRPVRQVLCQALACSAYEAGPVALNVLGEALLVAGDLVELLQRLERDVTRGYVPLTKHLARGFVARAEALGRAFVLVMGAGADEQALDARVPELEHPGPRHVAVDAPGGVGLDEVGRDAFLVGLAA